MRAERAVLVLAVAAWAGCGGSGGAGAADAADAFGDVRDDVVADAGTDLLGPTDAVADVDAGPRRIDRVDPRIGTGGRGWWAGSAFVGAQTPFGMVQAGPDGSVDGALSWDHCSGYNAMDDRILAFSNTHLHGVGIPTLGALGFMPVEGEMKASRLGDGYASRFGKATEVARPAYYAVTLDDPGIRVELTASDLAALHRYAPVRALEGGRMTVVIDVGHTLMTGLVRDGGVQVDAAKGEVRAWVQNEDDFTRKDRGVTWYEVVRFDRPVVASGTFDGATLKPGGTRADGRFAGAWVTFDAAPGEAVTAAIGVSYVDLDGAAGNLDADAGGLGFDAVRARSEALWEEALGAATIEGGTEAQQTVFATSVYHAMLMPSRLSDADGRYRGLDRQVHVADGWTYYSNFSLWDTYRNLHSLLILVAPERQRDMVRSLVRMYEEGGCLPRWPLADVETRCMIGTPADAVIAETWLKGIRDFDVEKAYEGMRTAALQPLPEDLPCAGRDGLIRYVQRGFLAIEDVSQSVSRTLEYTVTDAAIANLAQALGKKGDAAILAARSKSYANLWDPAQGFFAPRHQDGQFETVDPLAVTAISQAMPYTEGTPLQYAWLVPHDPAGLRALIGTREEMASRLESFFANAKTGHEAWIANPPDDPFAYMMDPPRHYWHGNEPDIHAAYLFLEAGRPDRAQAWLRWIEDALYTTAPDGVPGNDDAGTLAAWYIFSTLGFYPVAGSVHYWIGGPRFPRATLRLAGGATLVVEAPAVSDANVYVQGVTLDGKALTTADLPHLAIAGGGVLRFDMGPAPSAWGMVE